MRANVPLVRPFRRPGGFALVCVPLLVFASACSGSLGPVGATSGGSGGSDATGGSVSGPAGGSAGSAVMAGHGGSSMTGSGGTGGTATGGVAGTGTTASALLPARVRRLTNAEYDASVQALFGTSMAPSVELSFPPDLRQGPTNSPAGAAFSVNDAQRVDPVLAGKLDAAALAVVSEARGNGKLASLAPCADATAGGEACAASFVRSFGARAYRRAVTDEEVAALVSGVMAPFHIGADGHTYEEGIDLVSRIMLESASFLYVTELGPSDGGGEFELTPEETASALSYLFTSAPPDDALLAAAASGTLETPEGRESEARRLLASPAGRARLVRVVREWLGIENVAHREKSQSVYPEFASVSQAMEDESRAFIEAVLYDSTGTLAELLSADWTIANDALASMYGVTAGGTGAHTSLADTGRRGVLSQGAFLSVFANSNSSHPVFRGVAIARRIACLDVPDPGSLGIVVSFPAADLNKTTRARFEAHSLDPTCRGCHTLVDPFGFAFEGFDGMGKARATENGLPVDTNVSIAVGEDFDGDYESAAELAEALARSETVKACLARQLFRSSTGRSDDSVKLAEDDFIDTWKRLPVDARGKLADVLLAYVRRPLFTRRRVP